MRTALATQVAAHRRTNQRHVRVILRTAPDKASSWRAAAALLEEANEDTLAMRASDFLTACRYTGREAMLRVLEEVGCSEGRRIADLTDRQLEVLISRLRAGERRRAA